MIEVERDGPVAWIRLARPERGNALDRLAVADLRDAVRGLGDDVDVIALRGAGGRAFCGGADTKEMLSLSPQERQVAVADFCDLGADLWRHPALTVAVLDGYATGGGAHVAMACDLRLAAPAAWIQFGSAQYGLAITAVFLAEKLGPATATSLLASARRVDAAEGLALGLFQAVGDPDAALERLGVAGGGQSCRDAKNAIRLAQPPHLEQALRVEKERAVAAVALDRFVESVSREPSAARR